MKLETPQQRYYRKHPERQKAASEKWRRANYERTYKTAQLWNSNHKELRRLYQRNFRDRLKLEILSHYAQGVPKCIRCGIDDIDVLCIDHINGGGNKHRKEIKTTNFLYWLRKNNLPEGYQVLCANCNLKTAIIRRRNACI